MTNIIAIECKFGPTSAYAYYIDAPQPALIDTGIHSSASKEIEAVLKEYGKRVEDLQWIILTHGHVDHLGGAHAVHEKTNFQANVVIPQKEAYLLKDRTKHIDDYKALQGQFFDEQKQQQHIDGLLQDIGADIVPTHEVVEGDVIDLGNGILLDVYETPGHSNGSVTFVLREENYAFAADAVQILGGAKSGIPTIENPVTYRQSIQKLIDLKPARLYLGHHFKGPNGDISNYVIEGQAVFESLHASLALDEKIKTIVTQTIVSDYVNDGTTYGSFTPVAEQLGYTGDPTFLPCAFFVTVNGYKNEVLTASSTK